jgi:hypothetical protein
MSLPVLKAPVYTITIPSTKEKVKYRPFTVKEENALLQARESDDNDTQVNTMIEVLRTCTFGKVDVDKLATFDIEYLFINIRAKSVGETVDISMKCRHVIDDTTDPVKRCGGIIPFSINLTEIKVNIVKKHTKSVMISDKVGITFKYPSINALITSAKSDTDALQAMVSLVESIFEGDNIMEASSYSNEDLTSFIESIPSKKFKLIQEQFVDTMPVLSKTYKYKCLKCETEGEHTFEGMQDFFG